MFSFAFDETSRACFQKCVNRGHCYLECGKLKLISRALETCYVFKSKILINSSNFHPNPQLFGTSVTQQTLKWFIKFSPYRWLSSLKNLINSHLQYFEGPFHHSSLTDVIDGWLSFSALFLPYLLFSAVNISKYKAQDIWQILFIPCMYNHIEETRIFVGYFTFYNMKYWQWKRAD